MRKIKIGVLGGSRGKTMMEYAVKADDCEIVAVCDFNEEVLASLRRFFEEKGHAVSLYSDFGQFLSSGIEAVVLANYANEHAPFAIQCLEKGLHVLSEVLPVCTLKEAVLLAEAVEKSGCVYRYAENYCYSRAAREMTRLFRAGEMGDFEYAEGEYMHNCEGGWGELTHFSREHWRNRMDAFYYSTHSCGPVLHATGLRPVSVTGFEVPYNAKTSRMGCAATPFAVEMVTLENGGLLKSLHGIAPSRNSVWYCMYGSKGKFESGREGISKGTEEVSISLDGICGEAYKTYVPADELSELAESFGHGGSDFFTMRDFLSAIRGEESDGIGLYEALDMYFVGHFAHISSVQGGIPVKIPDFRDPAVRESYREDDTSVFRPGNDFTKNPVSRYATPDYPDSLYEGQRRAHKQALRELAEKEAEARKQAKE